MGSADSRYMYLHGGISCFQKIQMKSLETGLTEYHIQQNSIEYAQAMEDVWVYDFVMRMWLELSPLRTQTRGDCVDADGVTVLTSGATRLSGWSMVPLILAIGVALISY